MAVMSLHFLLLSSSLPAGVAPEGGGLGLVVVVVGEGGAV